jgi:rfaE bifunctional protein kinase chain/domain
MTLESILDAIRGLRVLVLGDICLDRWCYYDPNEAEPSRETGIPRIAVTRSDVTAGAGGTIANNLAALGVADVTVAGIIGDDGFGFELEKALHRLGVRTDLLVNAPGVCTFTYTKLINRRSGEEDRPRVDFINTEPMPDHRLLSLVEDNYDVVIVSDQAETEAGGVVTPQVRDRIMRMSGVVWVDSRKRAEHFHGVVLKPNRDEAAEACLRAFGSEFDPQRLFRQNALKALIVTHGETGSQVITPAGEDWVPARKVTPVDICGAGDSFSAGAACALAVTNSAVEAARFGSLVASITVTKRGTGTASREELLAIG